MLKIQGRDLIIRGDFKPQTRSDVAELDLNRFDLSFYLIY